jgi:hypothetical protein
VRRRRKELRLPPPMKSGEEGLFGGERTERIEEGVNCFNILLLVLVF